MTRLAAWWLRTVRRHFCYACDRTTFHAHRHSDREFDLAAQDWLA